MKPHYLKALRIVPNISLGGIQLLEMQQNRNLQGI